MSRGRNKRKRERAKHRANQKDPLVGVSVQNPGECEKEGVSAADSQQKSQKQNEALNKSLGYFKRPRLIRFLKYFGQPNFTDYAIALFTLALVVTSWKQWQEIHASSDDTHKLAEAAVASSRAWVAPEQMTLGSPVESGLPLKYQIRIVNPGKEPALGVIWKTVSYGVPYIFESNAQDGFKSGPNSTCSGLDPKAADSMVLYPSGPMNFWLPLDVPDNDENRQLIEDVKKKTKSLVIEGCFAYRTAGGKHTSSFRFFLRDVNQPSFTKDKEGNPVAAWNFNTDPSGNDAN